MSFNTAVGRAEYVIGAGQNDYTFVFKIYDTTDLVVSVSDSNAGAFVELIPTEYSVVINGDNGGTVSINVPLVAGGVVLLTRELPIVRTIEYSHGGDIAAATLNEDQDYQTYLLLDSSYAAMSSKMYHNKRGYENVSTEMPVPIPSFLLAWNKEGNALENIAGAADVNAPSVLYVDFISELSGISFDLHPTVIVREKGRGGIFNYDAAKAGENDKGTVFNGWERDRKGNILYTSWFGATTDNSGDNSKIINDMMKLSMPYEKHHDTLAEVQVLANKAKSVTVVIDGVCRTTDTLIVPAGVTLTTNSIYYLNNKFTANSLNYVPSDISKPAIQSLCYTRNGSGDLNIFSDWKNLPNGSEFDAGFLAVTNGAGIKDLVLFTSKTAQLGVFAVGMSGQRITNLCIGGSNGEYPKIGMIVNSSWTARIEHYKYAGVGQGVILTGANSGLVLEQPVISKIGDGTSFVSDYVIPNFSRTLQTVGIIVHGSNNVSVNSPTVDSGFLDQVIVSEWDATVACRVAFNNTHMEPSTAICRSAFTTIGRVELNVDGISTAPVSTQLGNENIFWVENAVASTRIIFQGITGGGYHNLVSGVNNGAFRPLEVMQFTDSFRRFGSWGDVSLISKATLQNNDIPKFKLYDTDPIAPNKHPLDISSIEEAMELKRVFGLNAIIIELVENVSITNTPELKCPKITFVGAYTLDLDSSHLILHEDTRDITISGTEIKTTGVKIFGVSYAKIELLLRLHYATIVTAYSIIQSTKSSSVRFSLITINSTLDSIQAYAYDNTGACIASELMVNGGTRNTAIDADPCAGTAVISKVFID